MTHLIDVDSSVLAAMDSEERNFIILQTGDKPIKSGDTVILQAANLENYFTCTAVNSEPETPGLRKGWQALTLKGRE